MAEITERVFPFTSYEQSEAEGIKESYKGPLCFPDNYGYQVATFAALTTSGLHAFRLNLTLKN